MTQRRANIAYNALPTPVNGVSFTSWIRFWFGPIVGEAQASGIVRLAGWIFLASSLIPIGFSVATFHGWRADVVSSDLLLIFFLLAPSLLVLRSASPLAATLLGGLSFIVTTLVTSAAVRVAAAGRLAEAGWFLSVAAFWLALSALGCRAAMAAWALQVMKQPFIGDDF